MLIKKEAIFIIIFCMGIFLFSNTASASTTVTDTAINTTGNLTIGEKITFVFGELIDNIVNGWLRITGNLNVTGNVTADYVDSKNQVAQFHREANATAAATNTWYNITWDMEVADETIEGWYNLTESNQSITITNFNGILRVQGCIHPYNNISGNEDATIYVRVLVNNQEARCLQASRTKTFKAKGLDIMHYIGTVVVNEDDKIYVQWRTNNTNLLLKGDVVFDNPVAASVNLEKISDRD